MTTTPSGTSAAAAYYAAYSTNRAKALADCAQIVRRHYPTLPT